MTEPTKDDTEAADAADTADTPPAEKPQYHVNFATVAAVITLLVGLWVVLAAHLFSGTFGLSEDAWKSLRGGGQLAARLIAPVSVLGLVLILTGAWMALVEWRGGFADKAAAPPAGTKTFGLPDIPAVIAAVGKLRGAALLIVVGTLLMALSAWVAQSVSDDSPREPLRPVQQQLFPTPGATPQLPPGPSGRPNR